MSVSQGLLWGLTMAIALPSLARPGEMAGPGHHQGPEISSPAHRHHQFAGPWSAPAPGHRIDILPRGVETVLLAGLTYYVLSGIYYQQQENHYIVVTPPPQVINAQTDASLTTLDLDGRRYYLRDGHYYQRELDGHYTEVPPPAALR